MTSGNYPLLNKITYDEVSAHFRIDYFTGALIRLQSRSNRVKPNTVAGSLRKDGYLGVSLLNKQYLVHRIIWLLHYKEWPKDEVDHIDGNRTNNKIENLRISNRFDNNRNRHGPSKSNKLGVLGVYSHKHKYIATIRVNSKSIYLGLFSTLEEAQAAYLNKKREVHSSNTL